MYLYPLLKPQQPDQRDSPIHDYRSLPNSRLLETDAMKSFQQESKYAESRQRDESQSYNNKFLDYSKSIDNKIVPNSSLYDSTPMKTYSQVSFTIWMIYSCGERSGRQGATVWLIYADYEGDFFNFSCGKQYPNLQTLVFATIGSIFINS